MRFNTQATLAFGARGAERIGSARIGKVARPLTVISRPTFTMSLPRSMAIYVACLACAADVANADPPKIHPERFGIHVVDEHGRGVPLVELRTVNDIRRITDNAGWIAWDEPGLMDREVFWHVVGPGIEREKDGFGFRGFRAVTKPGAFAECKVSTTNIATRIRRLTGQGLYRDSEQLGLAHPVANILEPGVMGQDSVQAAPFNDKLFWLWGDTIQARYPLGNFQTTCATTSLKVDPEEGFAYDYFRDAGNPQLLRRMLPLTEPGVVWMSGLLTLPDEEKRERLFAGFSRRQGLGPVFEQGVAEFDPSAEHFVKVADIAKENDWAFPQGNAVRVKTPEGDHFYFCRPFAHARVAAEVAAITDPGKYELLQWDEPSGDWQWRHGKEPTTQADEGKLIASGKLPPDHARFRVRDAATGTDIRLHTASIAWNQFRQRFVMIALQIATKKASPSLLGEMWYAESDSILGPWTKAVKIASHPDYSFYNPVHHTFFDREGGRVIYFEGTYTVQFSGNSITTPRYDYNQILYRLDLSDPRLKVVQQ